MEPHDLLPHLEMKIKPKSTPWRFIFVVLGIALIIGGSFFTLSLPPKDFTPGTVVTIPEGASIQEAGEILYNDHVIRSSSLFQFIVTMFFPKRSVIAGDFAFDNPPHLFRVVTLITGGSFGSAQLKATFPEGVSIREMNAIMKKLIPEWDTETFTLVTKSREGYLFPNTYLVFKSITPDQLVARLEKEYERNLAPLREKIKSFGKSEREVIIMASLLEKEARNAEEAKIVSGILWKRIKSGKPLQVDAPFLYTLGKTSAQLTRTDLQKDGPYNTYTRKGLPAGPIGNPGLAMITAALNPQSSDYWYYLHDANGKIYYAKTYEGHLENKRKYLR